ncbi:MAG: LPS export ABC transporter permease LptG [Xanthomonadaceae bacterium]|nr:LPS export ABC transporter permease LptG [Xanthomonadaceae bacterium]
MKITDRYTIRNFLQAFLLVTAILLFLFSFIELMGQLKDIGTGHYQLGDAFRYVILTTPKRWFDLLPVATLLGSIIGLGLLADHNELLAMQAAGLRPWRICLPILIIGVLCMMIAGISAEFIIPPLEQQARTQRLLALSDTGMIMTKDEFWIRQGNNIIRIGKPSTLDTMAGMDIYECDQQGQLKTYLHSPKADIIDKQIWRLQNVEKREFTKEGISRKTISQLTLDLSLNAKQLGILNLPPESLSPTNLYHYINILQQRRQNADHYIMALWQKLSSPLTTGAMLLLSLPMIFGPIRDTSAGLLITIAVLVGIFAYLFNNIIGDLGLLFNFPPSVTVLMPIAFILGISAWLAKKRSW